VTQARQEHADKADHPRATPATRSSDKLNEDGTLDADASGRVEQDGPKLPQPDGSPLQADGVTLQGKRLRSGREEPKRRLEGIQR
jgi:hypothetical protein